MTNLNKFQIDEIIIVFNDIIPIIIKENITEILEVKSITNDINLYTLNKNFTTFYSNIKNYEYIKNNLNLQLKHNQWHQKFLIKYKNSNNIIDYFYINFYNSFTKKNFYNKNFNFFITNYNLHYEIGINQYINNKFFITFSKENLNIFTLKNNIIDKNIHQYYLDNCNEIQKIMNPYYLDYIEKLSQTKKNLKLNLLNIKN